LCGEEFEKIKIKLRKEQHSPLTAVTAWIVASSYAQYSAQANTQTDPPKEIRNRGFACNLRTLDKEFI